MDPQSMASTASSIAFLYGSIAKSIKNFADRYNAISTTSSINAECSAISGALVDIQLLLSQPQALSSRAISPVQLENVSKNAYNNCTVAISRLEEEMEKCTAKPMATGDNARSWSLTHLCNKQLIKGLLQQIQRQLTDMSLLITAAQR
jgi:hypothetical protein